MHPTDHTPPLTCTVLWAQAHRRQVQELTSRLAEVSEQLQASQARAAARAEEEGVAHARIMELQVQGDMLILARCMWGL